jgi:hypothetical protein
VGAGTGVGLLLLVSSGQGAASSGPLFWSLVGWVPHPSSCTGMPLAGLGEYRIAQLVIGINSLHCSVRPQACGARMSTASVSCTGSRSCGRTGQTSLRGQKTYELF